MRRPTRALTSAAAAVTLSWALAGCGSSSSSGSAGGGTAATSVDGVKHLKVAAFAGLAAAPSTVVLDVRTPEDYATGHLPRAQVLDFRGADFDSRLAALDKQATYAVYCHSGNRSGQALERMRTAGFTHVADLSGGISAWQSDGRSITTG